MDGETSFSIVRCRAPLDALINRFETDTGNQTLDQQDNILDETQG